MKIELAGEPVELLAERALWRPAMRTLVIADTHWGKAAAMRAEAVALPPGTTSDDLARLTGLLETTRAERLVILGDLLHAREGRQPRTMEAVAAWRRRYRELAVTLVRGNHDLRAGDPPEDWAFECVDEPHRDGPFALRHTPGPEPGIYTLCGHLHPKARLHGPAGEILKLPCFRIGPVSAVLPAFSSLAAGGVFRPSEEERVFVIADDEVVEVPAARQAARPANAGWAGR